MAILRQIIVSAITVGLLCGGAFAQSYWKTVPIEQLGDDDIARNVAKVGFFSGIEIADYRFSENGFDWHLIRFTNMAKPNGPLWFVPHDDENAAFDAMIAALKEHGGVGIAVNSGSGSDRMQQGKGHCGIDPRKKKFCDPNRNFDRQAPTFTSVLLDQRLDGQPIIALHTNKPGFESDGGGGRGDISIIDKVAFQRGEIRPRSGALFGVNPTDLMANYDTLGLMAHARANGPAPSSVAACGRNLSGNGIHFWLEEVAYSDGSLSNYLALNEPNIAYFNAESREEADIAVAASRHKIMVNAYLEHCTSGN